VPLTPELIPMPTSSLMLMMYTPTLSLPMMPTLTAYGHAGIDIVHVRDGVDIGVDRGI
jgi:hypothetical protein